MTTDAHDLDLLTTDEVAELLRLKPRTLEAWRAAQAGPPYVTVSRNVVRYRRSDLIDWVRLRMSDPPHRV